MSLYKTLIAHFIERELIQNELIGEKYFNHHIKPRHLGGSDNPNNLVKVTRAEHALLHFILFKKLGNKKDYTAFRMIEGGHTSLSSYAGKLGAEKCRKLKVNPFFNPELRRLGCIKAGKNIGKKNAESGHLKRIAIAQGVKRKGIKINKMWITNGIKSVLVNIKTKIPYGYYKGRVQKKRN